MYLRVSDSIAGLGSLPELENVALSLVGAPEREISDPVRRVLRVLHLEFIRVAIIWRAQSFIIHEIRLDRNLFLLLHLLLLELVLILILRDVRLKLADLHLFATVARLVDRKVAAIELARVEDLAKIVNIDSDARVEVIVDGAVLPLALASIHRLVLAVIFFVENEQGGVFASVQRVSKQAAIGASVLIGGVDFPLIVVDRIIVVIIIYRGIHRLISGRISEIFANQLVTFFI